MENYLVVDGKVVEEKTIPESDNGPAEPHPARGGRIFFGLAGALLAVAAPILLRYSSGNPRVLGRYSVPYAALLGVELALVAGCLALAALPERTARKTYGAITARARSLLGRPWALGLAIVLLWLAAILLASQFAHVDVGKSAALHALGAAIVIWMSFGVIIASRTGARAQARAAGKYALLLFMVVVSLVLCEAFLRRNPLLLPQRVLFLLPGGAEDLFSAFDFEKEITVGYRYRPGVKMHSKMMASEANLFLQQPQQLRLIPPAEDHVLLEASFTTDANGYRNASPLLERYPVVVSGDSFTSLSIEPRPWPSILAEKLSMPVLNLGLPGYGPQQEVQALIRYGLPRKPEWVILAYFEGNDLIDAENYEARRASGLGWSEYDAAQAGILERQATFQLIRFVVAQVLSGGGDPGKATSGKYLYPFTARIAGREVSLSFSTAYLSRLELSREEVDSLNGFRATVEAIRVLAGKASDAGAKLIVAYLPVKERCYAPYLPVELLEEKLGGARGLMVKDGQIRSRGNGREVISAAGLLQRIDGQRDALALRLGAEGIELLDLTPAFREAASRGETLYLTNDTHWSAAGHELAASVIAERLRQ